MTVTDRGLSVQEVEALSATLEIDLESAFKAMLAQAVRTVSTAESPEAAITDVEELFNIEI